MSSSTDPSHLFFKAANNTFALSSQAIIELFADLLLAPAKFRSTSPNVSGFVDHRGSVLPIVDFRKALGAKTYREEVEDIRHFILAKEQDHIDWLDALKTSAKTGVPFQKATDPTLCNFGQWYERTKNNPELLREVTGSNIVLNQLFTQFDAPHRRIHALADQVLRLSESGKIEEATALIDRAWETDLASMKRLFKEFIHQFELCFQPVSVVVETHDSKFVLSVDSLLAVSDIDPQDYRELPAMTSGTIQQLCSSSVFVGETIAFVLNPDKFSALLTESMAA